MGRGERKQCVYWDISRIAEWMPFRGTGDSACVQAGLVVAEELPLREALKL